MIDPLVQSTGVAPTLYHSEELNDPLVQSTGVAPTLYHSDELYDLLVQSTGVAPTLDHTVDLQCIAAVSTLMQKQSSRSSLQFSPDSIFGLGPVLHGTGVAPALMHGTGEALPLYEVLSEHGQQALVQVVHAELCIENEKEHHDVAAEALSCEVLSEHG